MHFNKYILFCIFYLLNLVPLFGHKQIEALKTFCAILAREYLKKKKGKILSKWLFLNSSSSSLLVMHIP